MGQSKRDFEEYHILEVDDTTYKRELDFFEANTRHLKTIVRDEMFKDDPVRAKLLKEKIKTAKKLRDYEYNERHNIKQ